MNEMSNLRPRLVPVLLLSNNGLVKTKQFAGGKYLGDPINVVKIFNEKNVDELTILDINATAQNKEIDFQLLEKISKVSKMPICYGGGIKNATQAERILSLGVEKISLSSSVIENIKLLSEISNVIGKQSVVLTLDVKKKRGKYLIYTINGSKNSKIDLCEYLSVLDYNNIGEVVINSIDRDGTKMGYDLSLIECTYKLIKSQVTYLGGCSSFDDITNVFDRL